MSTIEHRERIKESTIGPHLQINACGLEIGIKPTKIVNIFSETKITCGGKTRLSISTRTTRNKGNPISPEKGGISWQTRTEPVDTARNSIVWTGSLNEPQVDLSPGRMLTQPMTNDFIANYGNQTVINLGPYTSNLEVNSRTGKDLTIMINNSQAIVKAIAQGGTNGNIYFGKYANLSFAALNGCSIAAKLNYQGTVEINSNNALVTTNLPPGGIKANLGLGGLKVY